MTDHPHDIDVTDQVSIDIMHDEYVELYQCVCGKTGDGWDQLVYDERDGARACDVCGRRLYIVQTTKVFEVRDAPD